MKGKYYYNKLINDKLNFYDYLDTLWKCIITN